MVVFIKNNNNNICFKIIKTNYPFRLHTSFKMDKKSDTHNDNNISSGFLCINQP